MTSLEEPIAKYGRVLNSIINAVYYRQLSFCSIHVNIEEIKRYIKAECEYGWRGGKLEPLLEPWFWQWSNFKVGEGLYFTIRFFGLPQRLNTVFWRPKWYNMYLIRGMFEDLFGLPRGTFEIRPL